MSESWLPMDSELNRKDNCSAKGSQNYSRPKRAPSRHRLCGGSVIIATYRSRSRHRRLRDTNCRIVRNHQRLILPLNRGIGGPYCPRSRAAKALTWMPTTTVRCGEKLSRGSGRVGAKVREAATVPALDRRGFQLPFSTQAAASRQSKNHRQKPATQPSFHIHGRAATGSRIMKNGKTSDQLA
jgi:hypothetical protein